MGQTTIGWTDFSVNPIRARLGTAVGHYCEKVSPGCQNCYASRMQSRFKMPPRARPHDIAWTRSIVQQCKAAGVAVFVKQLGADPHDSLRDYIDGGVISNRVQLADRKGSDPAEWSEDLRVQEFPV